MRTKHLIHSLSKRALAVTFLLSAMAIPTVMAQDSDKPKFKVNPTGRLLLDGALYTPTDQGLVNGVGLPDIRLGAKASYGKWRGKIDVGFALGKVSLKDVYIQYDLNDESFLRGGYFVHQFGIGSGTSSSYKIGMEEPMSQTLFGSPSRYPGVQYLYNNKNIYVTGSAYVQSSAMTNTANALGKTGVGFQSRFIYHPFASEGKVFQIGISEAFQTAAYSGPESLDHPSFSFNVNYPTRVSKVKALDAQVTDVKNIFKFTPEIIFAKGRFAFEGQYFYAVASRKYDLKAFHGQGAYGYLRGILKGGDYGYSAFDGCLATPAPKSMELVLGYNFSDVTDPGAGIFGGISNNASVTFNYYINKYIVWRLNYSYTQVRNQATGVPDHHANIFQTRIQIVF